MPNPNTDPNREPLTWEDAFDLAAYTLESARIHNQPLRAAYARQCLDRATKERLLELAEQYETLRARYEEATR